MSLGVGLGAFVSGMQQGMAARERFDDMRERRKNKQALGMIDTQARATFDEQVASGEANPDQYDEFWKQYAMPKYVNELMRQGEYQKARYLEEWGASDAARQGGKLFASSLMKAQTGNAEGAIKDAIKAAEINGYIERGGLELQGYDPLKDEKGNTIGYRFKLDTPEGDPIEQDVLSEDLPSMLAQLINPVAAFNSQLEGRNEKKKSEAERAAEIEDYEKKKQIDSKYAKDKTDDSQSKAYTAARKARMENDFEFGDLSPEEQDAVIRRDLEQANQYQRDQRGQSDTRGLGISETDPVAKAAPGMAQPGGQQAPPPSTRRGSNRIVIDQVTGEPVPVDIPAPQAQPSAPPAEPEAEQPAPARERAVAVNSNEQAMASPKGGNGFRNVAVERIRAGEDPQAVRADLAKKGMSDAEWRSTIMQVNNRTRAA